MIYGQLDTKRLKLRQRKQKFKAVICMQIIKVPRCTRNIETTTVAPVTKLISLAVTCFPALNN